MINNKFLIYRIICLSFALFVLIWWPLSHYLFSDFYHSILGFEKGTYPRSMVIMIGTCGILPVILIVMLGINPLRNRDLLLTLVMFSIALSVTYIYLINKTLFPAGEYFNVALLLFAAVILFIFYPRNIYNTKKGTAT